MEISMGILVDHGNGQIIYGDMKYVLYLEKCFGIEAVLFTEQELYIQAFEAIITKYPEYAIVRASIHKRIQPTV